MAGRGVHVEGRDLARAAGRRDRVHDEAASERGLVGPADISTRGMKAVILFHQPEPAISRLYSLGGSDSNGLVHNEQYLILQRPRISGLKVEVVRKRLLNVQDHLDVQDYLGENVGVAARRSLSNPRRVRISVARPAG
jgi:hypothetical protein